jgi:hypothetical protein
MYSNSLSAFERLLGAKVRLAPGTHDPVDIDRKFTELKSKYVPNSYLETHDLQNKAALATMLKPALEPDAVAEVAITDDGIVEAHALMEKLLIEIAEAF